MQVNDIKYTEMQIHKHHVQKVLLCIKIWVWTGLTCPPTASGLATLLFVTHYILSDPLYTEHQWLFFTIIKNWHFI